MFIQPAHRTRACARSGRGAFDVAPHPVKLRAAEVAGGDGGPAPGRRRGRHARAHSSLMDVHGSTSQFGMRTAEFGLSWNSEHGVRIPLRTGPMPATESRRWAWPECPCASKRSLSRPTLSGVGDTDMRVTRRDLARMGALGAIGAATTAGTTAGQAAPGPAQATAGSLTDVAGIRVGHYTDTRRPTGCTAILFDEPATAGADYDGSAPGEMLGVMLQPVSPVDRIHGILLTRRRADGPRSCGRRRPLSRKPRGSGTTGVRRTCAFRSW